MLTVRVSPIEVQVDVLIYTFNDVTIADRFEVSANANVNATSHLEFIQRKCLAVRCRPVDCDHEIGGLF